jgi:adenosine kinase
MSTPQIVVSGSIAIDRIMNFSGRYRDLIQTDKLHALSLSVLLEELEDSLGGVGANVVTNLALLGEKPVLLGSVGDDAKDYVKQLDELGVDVSHIHVSKLGTASFNVMTDSEDSQVGGFYQGAMADADSLSFKPWHGKDVIAMIGAHNPAAMNRQVEECKKYDLRLVYDPGQQVSDSSVDLKAGVMAAEVVFVNDYELSALCQQVDMSPRELAAQVPVLVTTLGRHGSVIEGKNVPSPINADAAKPDNVVDATGAGDAYCAGFLYGYIRNWDLKTCGQLGSTVASFIVELHGTQREFSKHDITNRYLQAFKEKIEL